MKPLLTGQLLANSRYGYFKEFYSSTSVAEILFCLFRSYSNFWGHAHHSFIVTIGSVLLLSCWAGFCSFPWASRVLKRTREINILKQYWIAFCSIMMVPVFVLLQKKNNSFIYTFLNYVHFFCIRGYPSLHRSIVFECIIIYFVMVI